MRETKSRGWFAVLRNDREWPKAPFDLKDNDGPSHLWVIANVLADKYGMEATADNIMRRAEQWAAERALSTSRQGTRK